MVGRKSLRDTYQLRQEGQSLGQGPNLTGGKLSTLESWTKTRKVTIGQKQYGHLLIDPHIRVK